MTHQDLMDADNTRMHEAYLDPDTRAAILAEGETQSLPVAEPD